MGFDIYDLDTANLVESFPTEQEALEMVRRALDEDGPESVESRAIGRSDGIGKALSVHDLIDRARQITVG